MTGIKTDTGEFMKSRGDVIMQQGTDTLYCDSLYQNKTTNIIEAFSHVRIAQQDGTQAVSDYLRYTSSKKLALMSGNVQLTDGKNRLDCEDLTYDLGTKTGVFSNWGTLKNDSTTVTSRTGEYNVKSHEARFTGKALITDPQYVTKSEDVGYNTETKMSRFFAKSVVTGDSGRMILHTSSGYYNSQAGEAYFTTHSTIQDDDKYIEGDTLYYNKLTGYGYGYGHVISIDTSRHSTLFCGRVIYFQKKRVMWAMIKPVIEQVNGKDTLYMRADTFYSAPMLKTSTMRTDTTLPNNDSSAAKTQIPTAYKTPAYTSPPQPRVAGAPLKDTAGAKDDRKEKKHRKKKDPVATLAAADTSVADSTAPLMFIGYNHVKIFSDSLQGVCDSIIYTQSDSTVRMIYSPIAWSRNSQITGDTICLLLDSSRLKSIYVPNNAFVASRSGPVKANFYDQVQGKVLRGYFKNNTLTKLIVYPNSEAIYYSTDDHGAYIGVSQAKSDSMLVFFEDQQIKKIKLESDVHQTLTPLEKADLPGTRLSRFKWLDQQRPRSKEELFD